MGLDMYLSAEIAAPQDSALARVVNEALTSEHQRQLAGEESLAYISGWDWDHEPAYDVLTKATGVTPHEDNPHFQVYRDEDTAYRVSASLFYWRKANAIHRWFVERCQGGIDECQRTLVHPEMLMELLDRCKKVSADHTLADDLLPSQSGFFFGSTEYDEWYFRDLEETAKCLPKQIAQTSPGTKFYYRSSW